MMLLLSADIVSLKHNVWSVGDADWFDGLDTFMRYICHRSWLGGWFLPQQKSYFALQLPHGWWIFGLDQALHGDIDIFQFKYFKDIIKEKVCLRRLCGPL
jgi:hypothetical protein